MVQDNNLYKKNLKILESQLDYAFDGITAEGEALIPLIEIFKENQNLDINSFENKDADEFKTHIEMFQDQDNQFKDLKSEIERGMFKFISGNLIEKIKHSTTG